MKKFLDEDIDKWTGKDFKRFVDVGLELEKECESEEDKARVWDGLVFQMKKEWNDRFNLGLKEIEDYRRELAVNRWRAYQMRQVYGENSIPGRYYDEIKDLD